MMASSTQSCSSHRLVTDDQIIAIFKTHRAEFNQVVQTVETQKLTCLGEDVVCVPRQFEPYKPNQWSKRPYKDLFMRQSLPFFEASAVSLWFLMDHSAVFNRGTVKLIVWSRTPPKPLISDTDSFFGPIGYRSIGEDWYICEQNG
jgi:hypothetical protein